MGPGGSLERWFSYMAAMAVDGEPSFLFPGDLLIGVS
jgi:hypothetical protein